MLRQNVLLLGMAAVLAVAALAVVSAQALGEISVASALTLPHAESFVRLHERVRTEVLNASAIPGVARRGTQVLRRAGFDVVYFGSTTASDSASVVIDRVGRPELAARAAAALGIERVVTSIDSTRVVDVTVILGPDWAVPR
jgi:hypothetical protein